MEQQFLPDLMLSQRPQSSDSALKRAEGDGADPQHDKHEDNEQDELPLQRQDGLGPDQVRTDGVESVRER